MNTNELVTRLDTAFEEQIGAGAFPEDVLALAVCWVVDQIQNLSGCRSEEASELVSAMAAWAAEEMVSFRNSPEHLNGGNWNPEGTPN